MELQDSTFRSKGPVFKEELLRHPSITGTTVSTGVPGQNGWYQVVRVEKGPEMIDDAMVICIADYDYLETYEIEMVKGRYFDEKMGTDAQNAVVVNETAVKQYEWDDPIGKKINWGFNLSGNEGRMMKVIGVFSDYHVKSLHNKVQPMMIFIDNNRPKGLLTVKTDGKNSAAVLDFIENKWNSFGADRPFEYKFLEQSLDEMYEGEQKTGIIFHMATVITLMIALIGLLGLSSFIAEQKTKEIGIRKVVGASVSGILMLLYREFAILIMIGFILAAPLTWWALDNWLQSNFVYAINMSWAAFVTAGIASVLVGLVAISYHTLKAANGNMVEAVKGE
jgi:putative ABC transport system permease protein